MSTEESERNFIIHSPHPTLSGKPNNAYPDVVRIILVLKNKATVKKKKKLNICVKTLKLIIINNRRIEVFPYMIHKYVSIIIVSLFKK
jgi:hypothetical protein